jgi:hypothetical protein
MSANHGIHCFFALARDGLTLCEYRWFSFFLVFSVRHAARRVAGSDLAFERAQTLFAKLLLS